MEAKSESTPFVYFWFPYDTYCGDRVIKIMFRDKMMKTKINARKSKPCGKLGLLGRVLPFAGVLHL